MKHLGIDHGNKRIGIAVSDKDGVFAFPRIVLRNTDNVFNEIKKICADEKIEKIVLGLPISFSGQHSGQAEKVKKFADVLRQFVDIPLIYENEIFTSKMTQNDAGAAALILQSYLDILRKK